QRFVIKSAVFLSAMVGVYFNNSGRRSRPAFPSELQILSNMLHCVRRDHKWQTRYFQVVEFYNQVVVAIEDVIESIATAVSHTLSREQFVSPRVENYVEHCVDRRLCLRLV